MNDRNFHESTKSRMKWLAICMGTAMLIRPSPGVAQSNTVQSSDKGTAPQTKTVRMWDACDPVSFDAAVKPGTCLAGHHGQTNFLDFFNELQLDGIAGGWRFNPLLNTSADTLKLAQLELKPGDRISLQNIGGETHTFTKVEKFGGGFVAPLNPITGNPKPAPECAQVLPDGSLAPQPETDTNQFVEAGETELGPIAGTSVLPAGVTHWQCCLHPWMRMNVAVRDHEHEHDQEQEHEHEHQH
jgi:plastocyanin